MIPEFLYRYDDFLTTNGVGLQTRKFKVIKETPCGYWISLYHDLPDYDDKKWVSKTARKRFAYPTKEEARTSFIARKKRQIKILEGQLSRAKAALTLGLGKKKSGRIYDLWRMSNSPLTLRTE